MSTDAFDVVAAIEVQPVNFDDQAAPAASGEGGFEQDDVVAVRPVGGHPVGMPLRSANSDHFRPERPRPVACWCVLGPPKGALCCVSSIAHLDRPS